MWSQQCLAGLLAFASCPPAGAATRQPDLSQVESLVVEGTNDFRREHGLPPLRHNRVLEESARAGHRTNMLDADVVETGVAIAPRTYKGHSDYFAVQLFGRPRSASVKRTSGCGASFRPESRRPRPSPGRR